MGAWLLWRNSTPRVESLRKLKGLAPACADPFSVRPFQKGLLRSVAPSVPRVSAPLRSVAPSRSVPSVRSSWRRSVRPVLCFHFCFAKPSGRCLQKDVPSSPDGVSRRHNVLLPEDKTRLRRLDVEVPESSFSSSEGLRRVILELGGPVRAAPGESQVPAGPAGAPEAIWEQPKGRKPCKSSGQAQGPRVGGAGAGQGVQGPGKNKLYNLYALL